MDSHGILEFLDQIEQLVEDETRRVAAVLVEHVLAPGTAPINNVRENESKL